MYISLKNIVLHRTDVKLYLYFSFLKNYSMPITANNIVRHELCGLKVRIEESSDPTLEKLSGVVVDESYNMLKIEVKETKGVKKRGKKKPKEKSIPKRNSIFIFTLPNGVKVRIDGELLVGRPEDRIKKKFERW